MAGGNYAFGKAVGSKIQDQILAAPSMNTTASPDEPTRVPSSDLANWYATMSALAQRAVRLEQTPDKQDRLFGIISDLDSWVQDEIAAADQAGAPVPNLPEPPAAPPLPQVPGAPGPGMPPPAAPQAPSPGAPAAPQPPGGMPA